MVDDTWMPYTSYACAVMERAELLANFSEEVGRLTRGFASESMRQANHAVAQWMSSAGMVVRQDAIGNLIGRYEADRPHARCLLLGSHLDTVRDAGKYDGVLGILVAVACVEYLHACNSKLPFAIEIVAFADEEGLRYHTPYLGSKVLAGTFDPLALNQVDAHGITMAEAIKTFGGDPGALAAARRSSEDVLGYCEVHIEQGPFLERQHLPVGVVSDIRGQSRFSIHLVGEAGHAGTVAMDLRHDALCAAAEFIEMVETTACRGQGLVATVGQLVVQPGASNVIPGAVTLSLDIRHQDDSIRRQASQVLYAHAYEICQSRHIELDWRLVQESCSVGCDPHLSNVLAQAISTLTYPAQYLSSGAGHDAAIMASIIPIAMLFVRCKGGISHHAAESVAIEDVVVAVAVMERFLALLAREETLHESL